MKVILIRECWDMPEVHTGVLGSVEYNTGNLAYMPFDACYPWGSSVAGFCFSMFPQ